MLEEGSINSDTIDCILNEKDLDDGKKKKNEKKVDKKMLYDEYLYDENAYFEEKIEEKEPNVNKEKSISSSTNNTNSRSRPRSQSRRGTDFHKRSSRRSYDKSIEIRASRNEQCREISYGPKMEQHTFPIWRRWCSRLCSGTVPVLNDQSLEVKGDFSIICSQSSEIGMCFIVKMRRTDNQYRQLQIIRNYFKRCGLR